MKLVIRLTNGEVVCVTKDMIVGAIDSIDYLKTKKKMLISRLDIILKEIDNLQLKIKRDELSLFPSETLADAFDRKMTNIDINSVEVNKVIKGLDKGKKIIRKTNFKFY